MEKASAPINKAKLLVAQALLILAFGISLYLLSATLQGGGLAGCGPESGCGEVLHSRWSKVASIPVSLLAGAIYVFTFVATLRLKRDLAGSETLAALGASIILCSAAWFVVLQLFVLHAICWYCMSAHLVGSVASLLIFSTLLGKEPRPEVAPAMTYGFAALVGLILLQIAIEPKTSISVQYGNAKTPDATNALANAVLPTPASNPPVAVVTTPTNTAPVAAMAPPTLSVLNGMFSLELADVPIIGPTNAPYKIVTLFDYTCHHCRETHELLHQAMRQFTNLALVSLPMPLCSDCNRLMRRTPAPHTNACIFARTALAIFKAAPEKFQKFDAWVLTGKEPPPVEQLRKYADELVGAQKLSTALTDPWINERIAKDVDIYEANSREARKSALPQLIFPTGTVIGAPRDLAAIYQHLYAYFGLTAPSSGAAL